MSLTYALAGAALGAALCAGYGIGAWRLRRARKIQAALIRRLTLRRELFDPIPAPWWAIPHPDHGCVNAMCRVHFPYATCTGMASPTEWCDRARDHEGDHATEATIRAASILEA